MQGMKRGLIALAVSVIAVATGRPAPVDAQETLAWEATGRFQYNIDDVVMGTNPTTLKRHVTVTFSVTDPTNGGAAWDIKTALPFKTPPTSRLAVIFGWTTKDYQNTGSENESLAPIPWANSLGAAAGKGAALPISANALTESKSLGNGKYSVERDLPSWATGTGVIGMEGHPAWSVSGVVLPVPVKNVFRYFAITDTSAKPRRTIVAIEKCQACHDGGVHGDVEVPRLSLHGGNRTEELRVCVICHNPNQTDIPYRASGAEVSIDFKRMVHAIHASERRQTPFIVTGFRGTLFDFSDIKFPGVLSNCLTCHVDINGRGTFELPLSPGVLGSTISTGSIAGTSVDVDPRNDRKITPIAAACSACHDSNEVRSHMTSWRAGGSFSALQADIDSGRVKERCRDCHGPGGIKDVRRVHEIPEEHDD